MLVYPHAQKGMVLLVSLIFLLLLSLIGIAAMTRATEQEKMAAGIQHANHSFQAAEAALRQGESWLRVNWPGLLACTSPFMCVPPASARIQRMPGFDPISGVRWLPVAGGLYGIQSLGPSMTPADYPANTSTWLYRITGIGLHGQSRTVLESLYARYQDASGGTEDVSPPSVRRVMWRQIQ